MAAPRKRVFFNCLNYQYLLTQLFANVILSIMMLLLIMVPTSSSMDVRVSVNGGAPSQVSASVSRGGNPLAAGPSSGHPGPSSADPHHPPPKPSSPSEAAKQGIIVGEHKKLDSEVNTDCPKEPWYHIHGTPEDPNSCKVITDRSDESTQQCEECCRIRLTKDGKVQKIVAQGDVCSLPGKGLHCRCFQRDVKEVETKAKLCEQYVEQGLEHVDGNFEDDPQTCKAFRDLTPSTKDKCDKCCKLRLTKEGTRSVKAVGKICTKPGANSPTHCRCFKEA